MTSKRPSRLTALSGYRTTRRPFDVTCGRCKWTVVAYGIQAAIDILAQHREGKCT